MDVVGNRFRTGGAELQIDEAAPAPSHNVDAPRSLLARCPRAGVTPLVTNPDLAARAGIAELYIKDERGRMGLGSFKALGAAYVIACDADAGLDMSARTYITASAGNHGLSVAAGAAAFKAQAVIYIAETVPESFALRLSSEGAKVIRDGATYEDSMAAAARAAEDQGWILLSDSSWPGYFDLPHRLMEGYLVAMAEAVAQMDTPPTHVLLQAGVGGFAGAMAAYARHAWGDAPRIVVVEPEYAPALQASIVKGQAVVAPGPVSEMGRLDCKEPSLIALKGLARDADVFATISEEEANVGTIAAGDAGVPSTPSGTAGLSALLADGAHDLLELSADARVLVFFSEGPDA
jgi:diaminopropionate ammonia-lyase